MKKAVRALTVTRIVALVFMLGLVLTAYGALLVPGVDPYAQNIAQKFSSPGANGFILGSDELGRDILSRLLHGVRVELMVAFSATIIAMVLGTVLGLLSGYFRTLGDLLLMRVVDVILAFPPIIIALMATTLYGTNKLTLILVMGVLFVPSFARVVYGQVLSVASQEFVEASRVFGAGTLRRIFTVVLPNCLTPIIVQFSLVMATAILLESGLSFLGLGIQPPEPSLGSMVATAQRFMSGEPLQLLIPAAVVTMMILSLGFIGDFLRDALDPRV